MVLFANWKNSLKLTAVSALLFPLHLPRMAPREDLCNTHWVQCSTACIWQAEFDTQCAVSVCQIPQVRHLLSNAAAHQGDRLQVPSEVLNNSSHHYWMLDSDPELSGFPSTPVSEVPIGVLLLAANLYHQQKGCWCSSSTLWRQRPGPWLLLCSQNPVLSSSTALTSQLLVYNPAQLTRILATLITTS